ncbi:hypothetical protein [Neobacillus sp. PS3-40]|uniref:hypothetical protein n=1 Tax=Neobacillus sp. PS3-40 TaxID=3070679 RepID=UPI0027E00D9B|nr:hypothetical protein [Neobacillus sp. PS3-40]WML45402.1 hypothetical protein RCG20_05730 [Neobacillus sp. PS3-40]
MNVIIQMVYSVHGSKNSREASFPPRGKRPEELAYDWWKQIKKEMSYFAKLEKVVVNGEQDITETMINMENAIHHLQGELPF